MKTRNKLRCSKPRRCRLKYWTYCTLGENAEPEPLCSIRLLPVFYSKVQNAMWFSFFGNSFNSAVSPFEGWREEVIFDVSNGAITSVRFHVKDLWNFSSKVSFTNDKSFVHCCSHRCSQQQRPRKSAAMRHLLNPLKPQLFSPLSLPSPVLALKHFNLVLVPVQAFLWIT